MPTQAILGPLNIPAGFRLETCPRKNARKANLKVTREVTRGKSLASIFPSRRSLKLPKRLVTPRNTLLSTVLFPVPVKDQFALKHTKTIRTTFLLFYRIAFMAELNIGKNGSKLT